MENYELLNFYTILWIGGFIWNKICYKVCCLLVHCTFQISKPYASLYLLKVKVTQSCLTLCHPMCYTAHGILQARILEWIAFPFCRGSSQPRDLTWVSHIVGKCFSHLSHQGSQTSLTDRLWLKQITLYSQWTSPNWMKTFIVKGWGLRRKDSCPQPWTEALTPPCNLSPDTKMKPTL